MSYLAKIILDSVISRPWLDTKTSDRLTTFELTYPRFVHSELMTHRVFSRNSASSRAIPIEKMITQVINNPVIPVEFGKNQPGMQAKILLSGAELERAKDQWLTGRDYAVQSAYRLTSCDVHKQIVNRVLEPWMWITVIVSATEWQNFFKLRCHADAQPEIRKIAEMARELYERSQPKLCHVGDWHIPMIDADEEEPDNETNLKIATGRIARVSYLTHDGIRSKSADIALHDRLLSSGHWSPFEHCAQAIGKSAYTQEICGNFQGWLQYRKTFAGESGRRAS